MQGYVSIKENKDFKRLYYRGKSFVTPYFVMYLAKGRTGKVRIGITAGKKIGCAVKRNRAKRLIRAAFNNCFKNIIPGYDFVIVARSKIIEEKSNTVAKNLEKQLRAAGVWCENATCKQPADKTN
ncbi:MAG: ribonuclease P protein component [Clostridia bacterium]|nr:ribonuclease P protein component [Clostridia bacterium]